jgi:hypothetical protein
MNKELTEKLRKKYPSILRDLYGDPRKTCMTWGIRCGDGWYQILDNFFKEVTIITAGTDRKFITTQIKEKFGGLRIYYYITRPPEINLIEKIGNNLKNLIYKHIKGITWNKLNKVRKTLFWKSIDDKIEEAVGRAEAQSYTTCEICSLHGSIRYDIGWIRTLCDSCYTKAVENYIKRRKIGEENERKRKNS